jgi:hypothetical protein
VSITVEDKYGRLVTYGYDPEHADALFDYYNGLRSAGVIRSFTMVRGNQ